MEENKIDRSRVFEIDYLRQFVRDLPPDYEFHKGRVIMLLKENPGDYQYIELIVSSLQECGWDRGKILFVITDITSPMSEEEYRVHEGVFGEIFRNLLGYGPYHHLVRLNGEPENVVELDNYIQSLTWLK